MNKSIFKYVEIITLPLFPIDQDTKLETKILDFISNSIIKIEKEKRRQANEPDASKSFNFTKSDTIIGIDISSIPDNGISYLESLTDVIYLYPFILINSSISGERLKTLRLHKKLQDKGFILPCIPRLNPADILYTAKRYGNEFLNLIRGNINTLPIQRLENIDNYYNLDDLISRYQHLKEQGGLLSYEVNITWLGVEDNNISNFLNTQFNNNIIPFKFSHECSANILNMDEFLRYKESSMLFDSVNQDETNFRFIRSNIIPSIKSGLMQEFENKKYERSVIDTSHTDYKDFKGTFLEYHDLGKLFEQNDTYSIKLITDIIESFHNITFDRVVIIDNGYEESLRVLATKLFHPLPVSLISNNFGNPLPYPFDDFNHNEKILLISDICNRGELLQSVINFIHNEFNSNVVGIYSFIINTNLNIMKLRIGSKQEYDFTFKYYVEKTLNDVSNISKKRQEIRRRSTSNERYLFFWDTINKLCSVEKRYNFSGSREGEFLTHIKQLTSIYLQNIEFHEHADTAIRSHSDLSYFVKDIIDKHKFTLCFLNNGPSAKIFARILKLLDNNIKIKMVSFNKPDDSYRELYHSESSILIFDDGLNACLDIWRFMKSLDAEEEIKKKNNISIFCLFERADVVKKTEYLTSQFRENVKELVSNRLYTYYISDLPFYLFLNEDDEYDHIKRRLENIWK